MDGGGRSWTERERVLAKAAFSFYKIQTAQVAFKEFCKRKKIDFDKLQGAMSALNIFANGKMHSFQSECAHQENANQVVFTRRPFSFPGHMELQSIDATQPLEHKFSYFYKKNSEPKLLKELRKFQGKTAADLDFESGDLHQTASFCHLTERELSLLKQLKRAYRSPALRWSEGLQVMEQLLPLLDNLSPDFMRMALSVIGSDHMDSAEASSAVMTARQTALLSLLEKSERHLSEPELHPAYFSYAALLQIFLIHSGASKDVSW